MAKHFLVALMLVVCAPYGTAACSTTARYIDSTPEHVEEALRLAADEKAAARFLNGYVVQTRAGWGNGPLIGSFSTPFSRVVQAALSARRRAAPFVRGDVPAELLAPEFHVVATTQKGWPDDTTVASVQAIVLGPRGARTRMMPFSLRGRSS
jgi:hypothetical protein